MPDIGAMEKLAKGRAIARRKAPYFTSLIYGLVPIEAPGCGTLFVTPNMVMGYDPDYVKKLTDEETAGAIAHEANHVVRKSHERILGGDPYIRNLAADIPINEDLKASGFELPQGVVYANTYGMQPGKTMEEYYDILAKLQSQNKLPPPPQNGMGHGRCGGGGGNPVDPGLEDQLDQQAGRSAPDKKRIEKQAAADIRKHAAQGRGNIPGGLLEEIGALDGPAKVPWHQQLSHTIRKAITHVSMGATDYSMSRPSNRTFARDDGIIRPGLVSYQPGVLLGMDTSGSMGQDQLRSAFREVIGVLRALPSVSHVHYFECDTDVQAPPRRISIRDLSNIEVSGRGGTDFKPAIEAAQNMKPKPDILIYFTDGDGFAPQEPPRGIEVIWCVVPSYYRRSPATWGTTIFVDSDDAKDVEEEDEEDDT